MRNWINLFEMNAGEAREVFFTLGVNANGLAAADLKKAYRELMFKHHPDRGGDVEIAKKVSAAYDVLKDQPSGSSPREPEPRKYETPKTFHNIDYVKQYFDEESKDAPSQMWTVMNFDGYFFRGSWTVRGNHQLFTKMAEIMKIWDRFHSSEAIMIGTKAMLEKGTLIVIDVRGKPIVPFVTLEFDSFNLNPANDQSFTRKLPQYLDAIERGQFVSQGQSDETW